MHFPSGGRGIPDCDSPLGIVGIGDWKRGSCIVLPVFSIEFFGSSQIDFLKLVIKRSGAFAAAVKTPNNLSRIVQFKQAVYKHICTERLIFCLVKSLRIKRPFYRIGCFEYVSTLHS